MIFDKLKNIFERVMPQVDTSDIKPETVLTSDLGVDSLNMLLLAVSVEEEFGINFEPSTKIDTVKDICDYVEGQLA